MNHISIKLMLKKRGERERKPGYRKPRTELEYYINGLFLSFLEDPQGKIVFNSKYKKIFQGHTLLCLPRTLPVPTMVTVQQLVGIWCLVKSKSFDKYIKELGVGMTAKNGQTGLCHHFCWQKSHHKNWEHTENNSFRVTLERNLKKLQMMAEKFRLSATL